VAAGDVANGIAKANQDQAEANAHTVATNRGAGQNGAAASQQHQKHCAEALSQILFHNKNVG
jgi:hypothetical protein